MAENSSSPHASSTPIPAPPGAAADAVVAVPGRGEEEDEEEEEEDDDDDDDEDEDDETGSWSSSRARRAMKARQMRTSGSTSKRVAVSSMRVALLMVASMSILCFDELGTNVVLTSGKLRGPAFSGYPMIISNVC